MVFEGNIIESEDWKDFYPDAEEARPRNNLKPLEEPVTVREYADYNMQVTCKIGGPTQGC